MRAKHPQPATEDGDDQALSQELTHDSGALARSSRCPSSRPHRRTPPGTHVGPNVTLLLRGGVSGSPGGLHPTGPASAHPDHGRGGPRLPRLQRALPGRPGDGGGRVHRRTDTRDRRPAIPARTGRTGLSRRHPDPARGRTHRVGAGRAHRRGRVRVLRPAPRRGHAQGVDGAGGRRRLHVAGPEDDESRVPHPGHRSVRFPHRRGQESDQPTSRAPPPRRGSAGRTGPSPDAVRRSRRNAGAALRHARRHRRRAPDGGGA